MSEKVHSKRLAALEEQKTELTQGLVYPRGHERSSKGNNGSDGKLDEFPITPRLNRRRRNSRREQLTSKAVKTGNGNGVEVPEQEAQASTEPSAKPEEPRTQAKQKAVRNIANSLEWDEDPVPVKPMLLDLETLEVETSWDGTETQHLPYLPPRRKAGYLYRSLKEQE